MSKDIIFRCDSDGCPKGNFVFRNVSKEGKKYVVKHVAKGVWGGQNRSTIIHNFGDGIFRNLSKMVALWSSLPSPHVRQSVAPKDCIRRVKNPFGKTSVKLRLSPT